VFGVDDGGYRRSNAFWTAYSLATLVEAEPEPLRIGAVAAVSGFKGRQRYSTELMSVGRASISR
jgi:hypothetical protein